MAAVLNPFLRDSVVAEAMLAMVWCFHGLEAQTDKGALSIQEHRGDQGDGLVTLGIQSMQRGWPMQVIKKNVSSTQYYHLELSDSQHSVRAMIHQKHVRAWEYDTGESFEDILPGTVLQVDIAKLVLKPKRTRGPMRIYVPWIVIRSFKVAGCQGENIFGRPFALHADYELNAIAIALKWWSARKSAPLPSEQAERLIQLHGEYVNQHGDRLSDRYLSWLQDILGDDHKDPHQAVVKRFAQSIPAISRSLVQSQEHGMSASIATGSFISDKTLNGGQPRIMGVKPGAAKRGDSNADNTENEDAVSEFGPASSQMHPSSVISIDDATERAMDAASKAFQHTIAGVSSPVTPVGKDRKLPLRSPNTLSPSPSPFKRRDAAVRTEQRALIADKNEAAWANAKTGDASKQRLPPSILQALLDRSRQVLKPDMPADDATQHAAKQAAVNSIEEDERAPPSASQETRHASEWTPSPPESPRRQPPPDTDDESSPNSKLRDSREEPFKSSHAATSSSPLLANQPRVDHEQGIAEAAGYSLDLDEDSASPSPTPAAVRTPPPCTPAVQVRATLPGSHRTEVAPVPVPAFVQVPATIIRPVNASTARKRRSAEFEEDLQPTPADSQVEDPVHAAKRARADFMAEQRAERAAAAAATTDQVTPIVDETPTSTSIPNPVLTPMPLASPSSAKAANSIPISTPAPTLTPSPPAPVPGTLHAEFLATYPSYAGAALEHFSALCGFSAAESAAGRLPQYALDDFVLRHHTAYAPFIADNVRALEATRGVLNATNVGEVVGSMPGSGQEVMKRKVKTKKDKGQRGKEKERAVKVFKAFARK